MTMKVSKVSYVTDKSRDACLENMMAKTGVKTKQAMIDNAIVAFEWLVEKMEEDRIVIAVHFDGTERVLTMPVLTHVRRKIQDD